MLNAVAKRKIQNQSAGNGMPAVRPAHDVEKGVTGLNAARNEFLPDHLSKTEQLDRLVHALGHFVGDGAEERGRGEESVWDVCTTCSTIIWQYLLKVMTPDTARLASRIAGPVSIPYSPHLCLPQSKRALNRLPDYEAELSYPPTR